MDTWNAGTSTGDRQGDDVRRRFRARRLTRGLMMAALACFALPFLTTTCYGETTVSGVQAATKIDIYPSDDPGEREVVREEPPNVFALGALIATVGALVLAFRSKASRQAAVGWAAAGVLALDGFYLYAFHRTWGEALPEIGLTGAIVLLIASAWLGVGTVPRWTTRAVGILALATLPITFLHEATVDFGPWLFLLFYAGLIGSVTLAVAAIQASKRPAVAEVRTRPSPVRMALAGLAGIACLAAAGVAAPFLMGTMLSGSYGEEGPGSALAFACIVLSTFVMASIAALGAGRAIVGGGRKMALTPQGVRA